MGDDADRDTRTEEAQRGPLDELRPGLRQAPEPIPDAPIHPRILRVEDSTGGASFVATCWADPGGPRRLHQELRSRFEATLLSELCMAPHVLHERGHVHWNAMRLVMFEPVDHTREAVRAFGLQRVEPSGADWRHVLAHIRAEAQQLGRDIPHAPDSVWHVPIAQPSNDALDAIEQTLLQQAGQESWGQHPGAAFRRLLQALAEHGLGQFQPTTDSLRALEPQLVPRREGVIRWIPPAIFQALCDGVALIGALDLGHEIEWAVCEPDEQGLAPPPLIRASTSGGGHHHVPLGLALLRWCVMPLQPGEQAAPLADWLVDQLGA